MKFMRNYLMRKKNWKKKLNDILNDKEYIKSKDLIKNLRLEIKNLEHEKIKLENILLKQENYVEKQNKIINIYIVI